MAAGCNDSHFRMRPPVPPPRRNVETSKPAGGSCAFPLVSDSSRRRAAMNQPLLLGQPPGPRAPPPLPTAEAESSLSVGDAAVGECHAEPAMPRALGRLPYKPPDLPVAISRRGPTHRTQRSVSDADFDDTFRSDGEYDNAGDESLMEGPGQCSAPVATVTPDVRRPLGARRALLCLLYAVSLLVTLAGLAPRAVGVADCQFQHTLTEEDCAKGGGTLGGLRRQAGPISTLFLATWLLHIVICIGIIVKCPSIFDRPVERSSIFRRLRRLHHFWTFLVITVCALAFEGFQFTLEKYRRPVALSDTFSIAVSSLWVLVKISCFLLMSILNYTPDMRMTHGWTPRVLYKLTLLVFSVLHFLCFLSTSVYVLLKVMPQGSAVPTKQGFHRDHKTSREAGDEILRVVAFLLLIMNVVFHAKMVQFFSAKILCTNKNLLHFVHDDVFRNRHAINSRYFSGVAGISGGGGARHTAPVVVDHPCVPARGPHATYYGSHSVAPQF